MSIHVGTRRELFVDTFLVDRLEGARLQLHRPRSGGVSLYFDESWARPSAGYGTVILDGGLYRLYYRKVLVDDGSGDDGAHQVTCYAESTDGVTWTKPDLGLYEIQGSLSNHVVYAGYGPTSHNFSPFLDHRPGAPASQRYKALAGTQTTGLMGFVSPDGLHWQPLQETPLLPSIEGELRYDSQNVAFWSEHEGCYLCYFRTWGNQVRAISRARSTDFCHWEEEGPMEMDGGPAEHLYINQTHPYFGAPHIYVALAARFVPGRQVLSDQEGQMYEVGSHRGVGYWHDCSEAVLLTSRGGQKYARTFLEGFVRPGPDRRNWVSRCNYPVLGVVPTGTGEMSLYVMRHNQQPTAHLERLVLRTDGFASLHASFAGGKMVSKPFRYKGEQLVLNYATGAAGHVQVELQDEAGHPIAGYALQDADTLVGDELDRVVSWQGKRDVALFAGQTVRLCLDLKDSDVYSFRFCYRNGTSF